MPTNYLLVLMKIKNINKFKNTIPLSHIILENFIICFYDIGSKLIT